jgi:hypothetical protein
LGRLRDWRGFNQCGFDQCGHGRMEFCFLCEIGDNLLWLRLFVLDALEIGRGNLKRVEHEASRFPFEPFLQDHLNDLAQDDRRGWQSIAFIIRMSYGRKYSYQAEGFSYAQCREDQHRVAAGDGGGCAPSR